MQLFSKNKENLIVGIAFLLIWAYIIIRSFNVFYIHDEIVSKWAYMVDWNFLPYQGYIDANNQFLISFLGGLFIRLFNSDSIFIVRLASILAFPILFYSIFSIKKVFQNKASFYFILISVCLCQFLLDFYSLARGYALAWSFMVAAISSTLFFMKSLKNKYLLLSLLFWLLAAFANLSFLPVVLFGVCLVAYLGFRNRAKLLATALFILTTIPLYYLTIYAFDLKKSGKLYLGSQEDFFNTVVNPISQYLFGFSNIYTSLLFGLLALSILVFLFHQVLKSKALSPNIIFPLFFIISLCSILLQNWVLEVNYPENRAVAYLLILCLLSFGFVLDQIKTPFIAIGFSCLFFLSFCLNANFNKTLVYTYEYMDESFLEVIPYETKGIPTSTGGRFWAIDNEMGKQQKYPARAFQLTKWNEDTLVDYIIGFEDIPKDVLKHYSALKTDSISNLTLFKRNQFLNRTKIETVSIEFENNKEYNDIIKPTTFPCFLRVKGQFENLTIYEESFIIFSIQDSLSQEQQFYQGFSNCGNLFIDDNGTAKFDLTFALNTYPNAGKASVYHYNPKKHKTKAKITAEVWEITD